MISGETSGPGGTGSVTRSCRASSPALPQTPQALVAKKWRSSPASSGAGTPSPSSTSTMLAQASPGSAQGATRSTSSRTVDHPFGEEEAERQLRSAPGVRMVTATVRRRPPWISRISSGSSVASSSGRSSTSP